MILRTLRGRKSHGSFVLFPQTCHYKDNIVWNIPFWVSHITRYKFPPCRSIKFTINQIVYLINGDANHLLHSAPSFYLSPQYFLSLRQFITDRTLPVTKASQLTALIHVRGYSYKVSSLCDFNGNRNMSTNSKGSYIWN
jgi:hypothetical protein